MEQTSPAPEEEIQSVIEGTTGDLSWRLTTGDNTLQLYIFGNGGIPDYANRYKQPWGAHSSQITHLLLGDGVTSIGNYAFSECTKLESITLPNSLTSIGAYAFSKCNSLLSMTIPESVANIGNGSFNNCNRLISIHFLGGQPCIISNDTNSQCFDGVTATAFYPNNGSWQKDQLIEFGGTITWLPYGSTSGALKLSDNSISLPVFDGKNLHLTDEKGIAAIADWKSSNNTVATVGAFGTVVAHKYGKCTITATVNGKNYTCQIQTLFWDVTDASQYYFKHVYWAAEKGITKGYNLEYFAPQEVCTREQMITFIWRLAGKPEPVSHVQGVTDSFSDVYGSAYYYKAVKWAVQQGITKGYESGPNKGKFGVGLPCAREQAMTFLWRLAGKPNPKTTKNPFSDVKPADYFYKATLWASENGIAKGYDDGTFGVGLDCLREHMVTFLHRYDSKFGS